jgi:NTE family protein
MSGRLVGTYWGIDSSPSHYKGSTATRLPGYSPALARDVIAAMRVDYDACSDAEAAVLENHGYLLADAAIQTHLPALRATVAPLLVPHPSWLGEQKVRAALRDSGRKMFLGHGRLRALLRREVPAPGPRHGPPPRPAAATAGTPR